MQVLSYFLEQGISIHAPRGGSDDHLSADWEGRSYFNPRSPWGERRLSRFPMDSAT